MGRVGMRRWITGAEAQGSSGFGRDGMLPHLPGENATDLGNSIRLRHEQRDLGRAPFLFTDNM
jgi:hypothetical protein